MPRILRIINRFNLGGPTYNATYLTRDLTTGFETMLIGGTHMESEESSMHIPENNGVKARVIPEMQRAINLSGDIRAYKKIREIIRDYKPDIVHTHASKAGFIGRLAAMREKVPVIVHTFHGHVFHSYFPWWKTAIYKYLERFLAAGSDAIVAISPLQKEELTIKHKICKPEKVHVIPLGFELDRFRKNHDEARKKVRENYVIKDNEVAFGIIGRLVPVKDHRTFLKAFAELIKQSEIPVRGFIAGGGEEEKNLKKEADSLGIEWNRKGERNTTIVFTSWIKNVETFLPGLDVVVLTSLNEGTPVSLIEAQAAGKPVISTRVGGVADVVDEGFTGFLFDRGNFMECARLMADLASDKDLRLKMGSKGWDHVAGKFGVQRLVSDMETLYRQLLNTSH